MKKQILMISALIVLACGPAFAQQPAQAAVESHKYRTGLTLAGAGGGFVAGLYVGLNVYDDAVNSDRKVWTAAIAGSAGGAVGGYFLGRILDKRHPPKKTSFGDEPRGIRIAPILTKDAKGAALSLRF